MNRSCHMWNVRASIWTCQMSAHINEGQNHTHQQNYLTIFISGNEGERWGYDNNFTFLYLCCFTCHLYLNPLNTTFELRTGSFSRIFNNVLVTHFKNHRYKLFSLKLRLELFLCILLFFLVCCLLPVVELNVEDMTMANILKYKFKNK